MISEQNDFSNFESLCHCDASHQVSAQSDGVWDEMSLKNFKMAMAATMPPIKFQLNPTYGSGGDIENV